MFHPRVRGLALAASTILLAACGSDPVTGPSSMLRPGTPDGPGSTLLPIDPTLYYVAQPGQVKVCVFRIGPASFTTTATAGITEASTLLQQDECSVTWLPAGATGNVDVTVKQTGPEGFTVDFIRVFMSDDTDAQDFVGVSEKTVTVNADLGAVIWFKNGTATPPPPPPPQVCDGLTPGYWKNWRNHYTEAQFASLLGGTIATSVANADAIFASFGDSKAEPIAKLRWFVLANQLTLALSQRSDLPNPDGAWLGAGCTSVVGSPTLGNALTTALQMLANPTAYKRGEILNVKDILDAIANLND